jgi:hypothetical protein
MLARGMFGDEPDDEPPRAISGILIMTVLMLLWDCGGGLVVFAGLSLAVCEDPPSVQYFSQTIRERRAREHFVDSSLARGGNRVGLHVGHEAKRADRLRQRMAFSSAITLIGCSLELFRSRITSVGCFSLIRSTAAPESAQ